MTIEKDLPRAPGGLSAGGPYSHPVTRQGSASLDITVSRMGDRILMVLIGELDGSTAASLRHVLLEVNTEYEGDVVLDIALLTFIDSTGLSLLVTEQKQLGT